MGGGGGNFFVQMIFLPVFATRRGRGEGYRPVVLLYLSGVGGGIPESYDSKRFDILPFIVPCLRGSFLRMTVWRPENTTYGMLRFVNLLQ